MCCCTDRLARARRCVLEPSRTGTVEVGRCAVVSCVLFRTDACFIRVIGSELVQKYVGEGARMVRELFEMARTKKVREERERGRERERD